MGAGNFFSSENKTTTNTTTIVDAFNSTSIRNSYITVGGVEVSVGSDSAAAAPAPSIISSDKIIVAVVAFAALAVGWLILKGD